MDQLNQFNEVNQAVRDLLWTLATNELEDHVQHLVEGVFIGDALTEKDLQDTVLHLRIWRLLVDLRRAIDRHEAFLATWTDKDVSK